MKTKRKTVNDVICGALQILKTEGWHHGSLGEWDGPKCILGALSKASGSYKILENGEKAPIYPQDTYAPNIKTKITKVYVAACESLAKDLPKEYEDQPSQAVLLGFNDDYKAHLSSEDKEEQVLNLLAANCKTKRKAKKAKAKK